MREGRGSAAAGDPRRQAGGAAAGAGTIARARRGGGRQAAGELATIGGRGALAGDLQPGTARTDRANPAEPDAMTTAFVDVDTQFDFLLPTGALSVPGAERIIPTIARLNRH